MDSKTNFQQKETKSNNTTAFFIGKKVSSPASDSAVFETTTKEAEKTTKKLGFVPTSIPLNSFTLFEFDDFSGPPSIDFDPVYQVFNYLNYFLILFIKAIHNK